MRNALTTFVVILGLGLLAGAAHSQTIQKGTLSGIMNTGANLGGTLSPTLTPWLAHEIGWNGSLSVAALIAFLGGLCWIFIRPGDGLKGLPHQ